MTELSSAEIRTIQPPTPEREFAMDSLPVASGVIVSPINVRSADGTVLMTWRDTISRLNSMPLSDRVLEGFVVNARKAERRFPANARAKTNLGIALLRTGQLHGAIDVLQSAFAKDPNDSLTALTLADALTENGRAREAELLLTTVTDREPQNVRAVLALGNALLRRDALDDARAILSPLLNYDQTARVRFMLGIIELKADNLSKAVGLLRGATHADVKNPTFHHALGVVYALQKNYDRALTSLRAALTLNSRSVETIHALGQVLLENESIDEAVHFLKVQTEKGNSDIKTRVLLARSFVAAKKHERARSTVRSILQDGGLELTNEQRVYLLNLMATSYIADQKYEEGELALKRAIEIGPRVTPVTYENLGRLYLYHLEDSLGGVDYLLRAKSLFPNAQMTRVLLAIGLAWSDDITSAINELVPLLDATTVEESVYVCLGWLYESIGQRDRAVAILKDGLGRYPRNSGIINNLAYTYLMSGEVASAKEVLSEIPAEVVPHAELVATHGLLLLWEGRLDEGSALYEKAESMATELGLKVTARKARQKKHLEIARLFWRRGEAGLAMRELETGLKVKDFPNSYRRDLLSLITEIDCTH